MQSLHETRGFWGVLAQKAKAILEEDNISQQFEEPTRVRTQMPDAAGGQVNIVNHTSVIVWETFKLEFQANFAMLLCLCLKLNPFLTLCCFRVTHFYRGVVDFLVTSSMSHISHLRAQGKWTILD